MEVKNTLSSKVSKCSGVYLIVNEVNKKVYIGSSKNINYRRSVHYRNLLNNSHHNIHLQRAFNKYGEDNFSFHVIKDDIIESDLLLYENKFINQYKSDNRKFGYNIICADDNHRTILPNEVKSKIVNSLERFIDTYGEELGKIKYDEFRSKVSSKLKAYNKTEEHCSNISIAKTGKKTGPCTESRKSAISNALKGRKMSKDHLSKTRRSRKCEVDGIEYESLKDAGIALGISRITVSNRIKDSRYSNYKYKK